MSQAIETHCQPYPQFIGNIGEYAKDFASMSGCGNPRLADIREYVKQLEYTISDKPRTCRAVLAAFACYMNDYQNCRIIQRGIFRIRLVVKKDWYEGDFFDLFHRVVFEGLDMPEKLANRQVDETE